MIKKPTKDGQYLIYYREEGYQYLRAVVGHYSCSHQKFFFFNENGRTSVSIEDVVICKPIKLIKNAVESEGKSFFDAAGNSE